MKHSPFSICFLSGLFTICFICSLTSTLSAQSPSATLRQAQGELGSGQAIPIAVVEFEGNGISQTEAIALTDRLRNELFRLGTFEVVERGMMESILAEQDFQLTGCTSNECLIEVGQLLGARQVIGGRISKVGAMFTVSARVVDVETGRVLGVSDYDLLGGLEEMLTVGMKQVALRLSGSDEIVDLSRQAEVAVAQAPPAADLGRYRWQFLLGAMMEEGAPMLSVANHMRGRFKFAGVSFQPAVSLLVFPDIEVFFSSIEAHIPLLRNNTIRSLFFGGGLLVEYDIDDVTLSVGLQMGRKPSSFPLIIGEFRLIYLIAWEEVLLTLGAGIRI